MTCNHSDISLLLRSLWHLPLRQPTQQEPPQGPQDSASPQRKSPSAENSTLQNEKPSIPLQSDTEATFKTAKNSVDSLIGLFEARESLNKDPPYHHQRAPTQPSPYLRERYSSALSSQKQSSTEYHPEPFVKRPSLKPGLTQRLEQILVKRQTQSLTASSGRASTIRVIKARKPRIRVVTSGRSVSIIFPEGIKLPIIATIRPARSFDSQMSRDSSPQGSESNHSPHTTSVGEPGSSTKHQQVSKFSPKSEEARTPGETQALTSDFSFPFLARVSKGRLNISEASVPPPTGSDISAAGEVFIPAHDHPSEWENKKFRPTELGNEGIIHKVEHSETRSEPSTPQNPPGGDGHEANTHQELSRDETVPPPEHGQKSSGRPQPNVFGEIIEPIPEIRITRPSTPIVMMATSLGTSVVAPATRCAAITPANVLSLDPESVVGAVPVSALTSTLALPVPLPLPGLATGGKKKAKVKNLIGFVRKHLLRKRLLALVLGRPVANIVHPLLSQAGNLAGALPLPVDGASDSQEGYTCRQQWNPIAQPQRLTNRLKSYRIKISAKKSKTTAEKGPSKYRTA
ncbi:hypothetical protein LTR84_000760 [Exophiala bonariae]|uniref:Uncharacterized protein n=1 Tax=Exophiala bonariae TaxID=1690606 RepID=A0AAV9NRG9_9EURO|nr:hypothetical protein LTR84_000760 [Exophiala bonariae]